MVNHRQPQLLSIYLSIYHWNMWPWHAALFFSSPSMQTVVLLLKLSPSSQLQPCLWITLSSSFLTHRTSFTVSTGTILNHYLQKQSMCLTGWGWGREGFHSYCSDIGKGEEREDTLSCLKRKQYAVSGLWSKKEKLPRLVHNGAEISPRK